MIHLMFLNLSNNRFFSFVDENFVIKNVKKIILLIEYCSKSVHVSSLRKEFSNDSVYVKNI